MADQIVNNCKGRGVELLRRVANQDPAVSAIIVVLLKTSEADSTLLDYSTLADLFGGSNVEADFTNYARKSLDHSAITAPTPDDANDIQDGDIPNQTWSNAGGASNNTLVKAVICYAPNEAGADSTIEIMSTHDFAVTTNGNDLVLQTPADGFYGAL